MSRVFCFIAIIFSLSLSAQKAEVELSVGGTYGRLDFGTFRPSPDASFLFSFLKEDRLTLYSGLRYDAIFYKRMYYPYYYYGYSSSNVPEKSETKTYVHFLAIPLQLNIDLAKEDIFSLFFGCSYKYYFGVVSKTTETYLNGNEEKSIRKQYFKHKPSLKEFIADCQLGLRIKLFELNQVRFNLMPMYEANFGIMEKERPELFMHSFSLKMSMNY